MSEAKKCIDCGVETGAGPGSARCPSCWDDKCVVPFPPRLLADAFGVRTKNGEAHGFKAFVGDPPVEYLSTQEHEAALAEKDREIDRLKWEWKISEDFVEELKEDIDGTDRIMEKLLDERSRLRAEASSSAKTTEHWRLLEMNASAKLALAVDALEKIADPRKRHKEPDKYTEVGCIMNIANEALAKLNDQETKEGNQ